MHPTKEQSLAINLEGSNIIVSAGAGSGKTAVLTERVLRKLKENIDIRHILVLTFTNEAALEMKARIRSKIKEANLKDQLEYLDAAYITTFDAYALAFVKKYHYLLNIPKDIKIIDSSIINLEKKKILEEIFLNLYDTKDTNFLKLVKDFTNKDDEVIKKAILNIKSALDLKYDKLEYLTNYSQNFFDEEYLTELFQEYFNYIKNIATEIENDLVVLEDLLDEKLYLKVYEAYAKFIKPKTYNDLYKIKEKPHIQFRGIDEEAIFYKDDLKTKTDLLLSLTKYKEEELKEQFYSTKPYVEAITQIILKLDQKLDDYKIKNGAFEFIDIAKMAIKILKENPKIKEELKNSYNEILVDEYQDTNDLQEMFITEIANNNVYMVGDIKQSIYRFRNANPEIFKQKYEKYSQNIDGLKIDLVKNFRSRREVLDNINEIFELLMTKDLGGVNYHDNHAMVYGNKAYLEEGNNNYNNNLEILKYENPDKTFSNMEIEAFSIAKDIKTKVASKYQVYDFSLKKTRPALYSDFCIILDRNTDMDKYKKIFEYLNIPMDVYKDENLTISNDILIIKNIIGLILNIASKIYDQKTEYYFVSIARSFLYALDDDYIFKVLNNKTYFETEIYQKCFKLAHNLEIKTAQLFLEEIKIEFNFYENLIKVGDILNALTRLDYLDNLALNAEKLGFTISDFKDYLEDIVESKLEIRYKEAKLPLNCVKIMNIHKSKGLEFPICYYAGLTARFNLQELNDRFMFDTKYGILTPYYKEGIGTLFTKELIKNNYFQEEISEKIRLFYVALTRAKEKIIMVLPEFKKLEEAKKPIAFIEGMKLRSFYDFLTKISLNLNKYSTLINLDTLNLTKDYEKNLEIVPPKYESLTPITFKENIFTKEILENKHASKTIKQLLTKEDAQTLEFGTKMHEILEMTDFKKDSSNKYINNLKNTFDFKNADIYQELEFVFEEDNIEYHGIIDLMLEYNEAIKIIDYKLKNIDDAEYEKQLNIYYKYIKTIKNKDVKLYLYSIMDNEVKEVRILETV